MAREYICSYHVCRKKTRRAICRYCENIFCKKHLRAKPAGVPRFNDSSVEARLFMEEYRSEFGHPCAPYYDDYVAKNEEQKKKYRAAVSDLLRKDKIDYSDLRNEEIIIQNHGLDEQFKERNNYVANSEYKKTTNNYQEKTNNKVHKEKQQDKKNIWPALIFISLIFFVFLYFSKNSGVENCGFVLHGECSNKKPFYCFNGSLIENGTYCGCPKGFSLVGEVCKEMPKCQDGTYYGSCSKNPQWYCKSGILVERSSICGCMGDFVPKGESCISPLYLSPKEVNFDYVLRGKRDSFSLTLYGGLRDHYKKKPRYFICDPTCPIEEEMELSIFQDPLQKEVLDSMVYKIEQAANNEDERLRIAVSLVQNIPYDYVGLKTNSLNGRYPYEVLYDDLGVCGEKSKLLAYLIKELGYGVALLHYPNQNHQAVGIKCDRKISLAGSGYCFIETTAPSIMTDDSAEYVSAGKLDPVPQIFVVSDGKTFTGIFEEYQDADDWKRLNEIGELSGGVLSQSDYSRWYSLVSKYGIKTG
jgi:hypothetical protein